jgi:FkbM family methyltransferase
MHEWNDRHNSPTFLPKKSTYSSCIAYIVLHSYQKPGQDTTTHMIIFKPHEALHYSAAYLPQHPVIVEAGACTGTDTITMHAYWPGSTIHAFEPVPSLYDRLCARVRTYPSIHTYSYALSNANGTSTLYVAEKKEKPGKATQASSLRKPKERLHVSPIQFPRTITVETITLDTWAAHYTIAHVDFLWLDLQGHELAVLQAASLVLKTVTAVFVEVAFMEAYEGQPTMSMITDFLASHKFVLVGRDFTDQSHHFFGNLLFAKQ